MAYVIEQPTNFSDRSDAVSRFVAAARDVAAVVLDRRPEGEAIRTLLQSADLHVTVSACDRTNQAIVTVEGSEAESMLVLGWAWLPEPITTAASEEAVTHAAEV